MRYSLLPDPARLNVGFLTDQRVQGVGDGDFYPHFEELDPRGDNVYSWQPAHFHPGRVGGVGDAPAAANTTTPGFWGSIGNTFVDLTRQYAPGLINWGITGNAPQSVVTPTGQVTTIPGGTQTLQAATGGLPPWVLPVGIGAAALMFLAARRK